MTGFSDKTPSKDVALGETQLAYPSERLREVFEKPIKVDLNSYYSERVAPPTPLDPDGVFIDAQNLVIPDTSHYGQDGIPTDKISFRRYLLENTAQSLALLSDTGQWPEQISPLVAYELMSRINNRCDHNVISFSCLKKAVIKRPPVDDLMHEIIMRARAGTATLPEAVRLLKEYPEMGSIEVANFYHLTGDHSDLMNAWHSIIGMSVYLKDHFNDAEVTLSNEESMTPSDLVIGTEVKKRVLVTIRSSESYSELVVKLPFLSLSDKNPVLGITAYLRDRSHTTASDPAFSVDTLHPEQVESLGTMDPNKARYILERLSQVAQQLRD